ncbi:MAG: hypothetical protein ABI706_13540 [Ilumatobacteraceae bacterium]
MRAKLIVLITAGLLVGTFSIAQARGNDADEHGNGRGHGHQLAQLRKATAPYQRVSNALADGYTAFAIPPSVGGTPTAGLGLPGDPTCFDSPAGGMGVHYVKGIDGIVDPTHPEALVYSVGEHGRLDLVAVEYIVPDNLVDPTNMPMLYGQMFHHHPYLPVFILHVWAWKHNPTGMFADWNPRVGACPAPMP